jgi:hypothetical protein
MGKNWKKNTAKFTIICPKRLVFTHQKVYNGTGFRKSKIFYKSKKTFDLLSLAS